MCWLRRVISIALTFIFQSKKMVQDVEKTPLKQSTDNGMRYKIDDVPPWYMCIGLGFQVGAGFLYNWPIC